MSHRGFFNRYIKGKPLIETLVTDVDHLYHVILTRVFAKKTIRLLCYPHFPSRGATIFRIARHLNLEITNKPTGRFDLGIYWEYNTVREEWQYLEYITDFQILNLNSRNIEKQFIDEKFNRVFGYSTAINPSVFSGIAVKKSNINAVHDGEMIQCPVEPESNYFYMKLIDSRVSDTEVMDMRVPILGNEIPHIYRAYRQIDHRFVNVPPRVELEMNAGQWLSSAEQQKLLELARVLNMDYCEFDTLRDADGRIYVVDANNTPQGPPRNLSKAEKNLAVASLAAAFKRQFLKT